MLRQDIKRKLMKNKGIHNYYRYARPEGHQKKISEKDIIRYFEKNPDLIKKAEGVKFNTLPYEGHVGEYLGKNSQTNFRQSSDTTPVISLSTIQNKKEDIGHVIKHELQHHEQDTNPKYKKLIKKWDKDVAKLKKKYENSVEAIKMRLDIIKKYGKEYKLRINIPWGQRGWEVDAERFANEPSARDIAKKNGPKPEVIQSLEEQTPSIKMNIESPSEEYAEVEREVEKEED
jgi:hypothetical protein